jgi:hypothetical protein
MTTSTLAERRQNHDFLKASRQDSILNPAIELGYPAAARPESGIGVVEYYRSKHRAGKCGRFFGLHITTAHIRH